MAAEPPHEDARRFVTDMVDMALSPDEPPVIGREAETDKILQILSRRSKNGVVLVGEPGVGKTTIVRAVARRVGFGDVPATLRSPEGCQVLALSARGYQADYLDLLARDIERGSRNVVLFIDNLHVFLQRCEGADGLAVLEDIVASRERVRLIVATTPDHYQRHLVDESGGPLEALQNVVVEEPSVGEACRIVRAFKQRYESHHSVEISDGAITTAVGLAKQYVTSRALPDSALDLIDEAATTAPRRQDAGRATYARNLTEDRIRQVIRQRHTGESNSSDDWENPPTRSVEVEAARNADNATNVNSINSRREPSAEGHTPSTNVRDTRTDRPPSGEGTVHQGSATSSNTPQTANVAHGQQSRNNADSHRTTKLSGLKRIFHRNQESKSLDLSKMNISNAANSQSKTTPGNAAASSSAASKTRSSSNTSANVSNNQRHSRAIAVPEQNKGQRKADSPVPRTVNTFQRHKNTHEKEAVRLLKANGFDPKAKKSFEADEALRWAAGNGSDQVVEYLLRDFGSKLTDSQRGISLVLAAESGFVSTVEILFNLGKVNQATCDFFGSSVLHRLVSRAGGYPEIIKIALVSGGAGLVVQANQSGNTPLHAAAFSGNIQTVHLLLGYGADVRAADNGGFCPLHLAARGGHPPTVETLLLHGADINAKSTKNVTPLFGAAEKGHVDAMAFLLQNGASVNVRENDQQHTPLHLAIKHGQAKAARMLIDHGASPKVKDRSGNTPVDMARTYWNRQPFEQFVQFIKQRRQKADGAESTAEQVDSGPQADPGPRLPDHPQLRQRPADAQDWSRYERDTGMVDPMIMRWD